MKKNIKLKLLSPIAGLTAASVIVINLGSCSKNVAIEDVKFNYEYSYVETGCTRDFSKEVKITPENATNKNLKWTISEESGNGHVATVDESTGVVIGLENGYCKLTCVSTDGTEKSSEQWIIVGKYVEVQDFNLTEKELNIPFGEKGKIHTQFTPIDATTAKTQHIKWTSNDPSIASVDESGNVTAYKVAGSTTITAIPYDYDSTTRSFQPKTSLTKTCKVTVDYAQPKKVLVSPESVSVETTDTFPIHYEVLPNNAKQDVTVSVEPEGSVTYDETTKLWTAVSAGTTFITFTSAVNPSIHSTCTVTISQKIIPVESIKFTDGATHEMIATETWKPNITVLPETATSKDYYFIVSDKTIAAVDHENPLQIKAIKPGKTNVTVYSSDGKKSDVCELIVNKKDVTKVTLPAQATVKKGETFKLTAKVEPEDATDKSLAWRSDNSNVAKVTGDGLIFGIAEGETNIIAASRSNPYVEGTCKVKVTNDYVAVESITIPTEIACTLSQKHTIDNIIIVPNNATEKTLNWQIDDDSILDVVSGNLDNSYVIVPKKAGITNISAVSLDGLVVSNKCSVKVDYDPIERVWIDVQEPHIIERTSGQLKYGVDPKTACQDVIFESDDPTTVSVDDSGFYRAIKEGEATITCWPAGNNELKATCHFIVRPGKPIPVESINFVHEEDHNITIEMGKQRDLPEIVYTPTDATNKSIHWELESDEYFSIDYETKKIIPKKPTLNGLTIKLTAVSDDYKHPTSVANVAIKEAAPKSIELVACPTSMEINDPQLLKVKVEPEIARQVVTFESLNPDVLVIENPTDTTCYVKSLKGGTKAKVKISSAVNPEVSQVVEINLINYISFVRDSWERVCENAKKPWNEFKNIYKLDCDRNTILKDTLIGYKRKITLNDNLEYEVRVIGHNHDLIAGTDKNAILTFELTNAVSGKDKKPLETKLDSKDREIQNSTLMCNLNGGSAKSWSKPMIDYVKATPGIGDNLKKVHKVSWTKWDRREFDCFLFPLSCTEIGAPAEHSEGRTYMYYQVKKSEADRAKPALGGKTTAYWLMSQNYIKRDVDRCHFTITDFGKLWGVGYQCSLHVAFAFCI